MSLQSQLFRGDPKLEAAAVSDPAHILSGAVGQHVAKIQQALMDLDGVAIDPGELRSSKYGPSTADAVLAYKRKRSIVNRSYQTAPDNIVGKMTIAALDRELLAKEAVPPAGRTCTLYCACPQDIGGQPARGGMAGFAVGENSPSPEEIMKVARRSSRRSLWDARGPLCQ